MSKPPVTVRVWEPFTFRDGVVRNAWVTWIVYATGERRAVAVEVA